MHTFAKYIHWNKSIFRVPTHLTQCIQWLRSLLQLTNIIIILCNHYAIYCVCIVDSFNWTTVGMVPNWIATIHNTVYFQFQGARGDWQIISCLYTPYVSIQYWLSVTVSDDIMLSDFSIEVECSWYDIVLMP